jgi:hypothetical protein
MERLREVCPVVVSAFIDVPEGVSLSGFLRALFIPGVGIWLRGNRRLGRLAFGASGALFVVFLVWLGYPISNLAFGLLLSLHVTSFLYYLEPVLRGTRLLYRILLSLILVGAFVSFFYLPIQGVVENHLFRPTTYRGKVMIVHPCPPWAIRRGELVVYRIEGGLGTGIYLRTGLGVGPVLASAGDRVRFTATTFLVNGIPRERIPGMPVEGEWRISPGTWMVWPDLDISVRGQVPTVNVHGALQQLSMVSEGQLVGKPFKRWFWRRQFPS